MRGLETQTEPRADGDAGDAAAELQRRRRRPSAVSRVDPRVGCRRRRWSPRPRLRRRRAAAAAVPTAIGAETETSSPPSSRKTAATSADEDRRRATSHRPRQRRDAGGAAAAARPLGRGERRASARSGLSESTRVAAGVAPWRSRAASISAPAVG